MLKPCTVTAERPPLMTASRTGLPFGNGLSAAWSPVACNRSRGHRRGNSAPQRPTIRRTAAAPRRSTIRGLLTCADGRAGRGAGVATAAQGHRPERWRPSVVASEHGALHSTSSRSPLFCCGRRMSRVQQPVVPFLLLVPLVQSALAVPDGRRRVVRRWVVEGRLVRRRHASAAWGWGRLLLAHRMAHVRASRPCGRGAGADLPRPSRPLPLPRVG
jgi:hypothetical protein